MFGLGVPELMVILVIALVIFGPSKLPQIGSGLGKAIRDFKKGVTGSEDDDAENKDEEGESQRFAPLAAEDLARSFHPSRQFRNRLAIQLFRVRFEAFHPISC